MKVTTALQIPAGHPAFAGHFPGSPIVPGVVLLDEVLHAIEVATGKTADSWQISSVKFLSPLLPGESAVIEHDLQATGSMRFDVLAGTRQIVTGSLTARSMSAMLGNGNGTGTGNMEAAGS